MKKCKCCGRSLPKSGVSSDYCLDCEDKVDEWIRLGKAAQGKLKRAVTDKGDELVSEAKRQLKDLLAEGEKVFHSLRKMLDD